MSGRRWLVAVHALDRTGPPVLARSWIRWMAETHPDDSIHVVAMRTGELLDSFLDLCPTVALLAPHEGWDPVDPDPGRASQFSRRLESFREFDATVLFSISGAQALPFLPDANGAVVGWVLEQGEDLHWFRTAPRLMGRITHWIAGADGTRRELGSTLPADVEIDLSPEFIEPPAPVDEDKRNNCRTALGARDGELLVVGAGIATLRKAPDLFIETALAARRAGIDGCRFVWIGGEQNEMFPRVGDEVRRLDLDNVDTMGGVPDLAPWFSAADVMLHPARLDAFPLVCLQSAALETPVVAFRESVGVAEMFGPSFLGSTYPDVDALAEVVGSLRDPGLRRDMASRQRQRVLDTFTSATAAAQLYDLVERAATT